MMNTAKTRQKAAAPEPPARIKETDYAQNQNCPRNGKSREDRNMNDITSKIEAPKIVDRATFQAELDALRVREKAHTHEGDAVAAARRRLPMVRVDGATPIIGECGKVTLLDAFEGRRLLIAYYFMW